MTQRCRPCDGTVYRRAALAGGPGAFLLASLLACGSTSQTPGRSGTGGVAGGEAGEGGASAGSGGQGGPVVPATGGAGGAAPIGDGAAPDGATVDVDASSGGMIGTDGAAIGGAGGGGLVVVSPVMDGKQTIMGPYNPPPEATLMPGAPPAVQDNFTYDTSKIFPGTSRHVDIFIPAQYVPGTPVPFLIIQDGDEQLNAYKTDVVLTNLIHQKRLPVMAAIFVNRPDNGPKRSLEYDCIDDDYSRFILDEIIPLAKMRHPDLNLTSDPNGRGSLGKSSGAPAAFTLGWRHPEAFTRITTFNGTFINLCRDGAGAGTYPGLVASSPMKPLRVYMFSDDGDNGGFAAGNQKLADALNAKGNPWRYVYGIKATHDNHFAASLITEALLWTWAGYPL
jgi:enterochelin esterase-like enzyme